MSPSPPHVSNDALGIVHFWTLRDLTGVETWDPDDQPQCFSSGYGHHLLEPYVRLHRLGLPVSIGERPPPDSRLVVCSLEELATDRSGLRPGAVRRLAAAALRCPSVLVVRGDR